jgi:hypothetical protein
MTAKKTLKSSDHTKPYVIVENSINHRTIKTERKSGLLMMSERPTFRRGIASLFNIIGEERFTRYMQGNDAEDLKRDWMEIGNDIRISMGKFQKK